MESRRVYIWGFAAADLRSWPPDLQPQPAALPVEEPVVVPVEAAVSFAEQAQAHPLPDGRLVDTILYLPPDAPIPTGVLFNTVVEAGDWPALRRLLACPQQFRVAEWAEDVPLRQLTRPVETLDLAALDLPEAAHAHLAACATCPDALRSALRARLRLRRTLICPAPARLVAFIQGATDVALERHLVGCPLCLAQEAVLRPVLTPAPLWAAFPLSAIIGQASDALAEARRQLGVVGELLAGGLAPRWVLAGAGLPPHLKGSGQPAPLTSEDLVAALTTMQEGEELHLVGPRKDIAITWDPVQQAAILRLTGREARPLSEFRVEIRRGPQVLWAADSTEGVVVLAPAELADFTEESLGTKVDPTAAYELVILARE